MECSPSGYLLSTSGSAGLLIRSGYIKKGRLLFAVAVASEISRTRNHHESGDADSLISLFPRPFYIQESNGHLPPSLQSWASLSNELLRQSNTFRYFSRVIPVFSSGTSFATDGKVHGRAFGRAISGRTANKILLARQRGRSLQTTFPRPLKQRSAPFAVHPPLGCPGGLNVQGIKAGVADHPNAGLAAFRRHPLQGLARNLQEGGAEEPGNPVVPAGVLQPSGQEILQRTPAGGITMDHPLSPF